MPVSRLLTQAAAFSAAILFIGFSFALAAVPGGANVVVEGWVVTTVEEAPDRASGHFRSILHRSDRHVLC